MIGCEIMSKFKNPFSMIHIFIDYHKKHLYKAIGPWLVLTLIAAYSSYSKSLSNFVGFEWPSFIVGSLIVLAIIYALYLLIFIPYYFATIYPHRFLLILKSPLFLKSLLFGALLLLGIPIIFGKHNLTVDDMQRVLTLSWTVFGISVTYALVTYFLVIDKLSKEKTSITKLGKIDHNASVVLSLSTFFLLALNVFFLSWSSLEIFLLNREVTRMNQILTQTSFWFSVNVVVSTTYDFIAHLKMKKKEVEFASAELMLEKNEIIQSSKEFTEIRKKTNQLTSSYKIMQRKHKRQNKLLDMSTKLIEDLELFNQRANDNPKSIDEAQVRTLVKKIKKYSRLKNELVAINSEIEKNKIDLEEFQNRITPPISKE